MPSFSGRESTSTKQKMTAGALQLTVIETGITARAGGTKAAAFQLTAAVNVLGTVATNGDSVLLPAVSVADVGLQIEVHNDGAANAQVFGQGSDTIDGVATATGVVLSAAKRCVYTLVSHSGTVGAWISNMGVKSA